MKNVRYSRSYPKAFGKLVDKLAAPAFKKRGFGQARVLTDWPAIVGHDIAAYCSPQRVSGDRFGKHGNSLHVAVLPAFALHLRFICIRFAFASAFVFAFICIYIAVACTRASGCILV